MADPVILELQLKQGQIQQQLDLLERKLGGVTSGARNAGKTTSKAFDEISSSIKRTQSEISKLSNTINEQEKITAEFRKELAQLDAAFKKAGGSGTQAGQKIKKQMDSLNLAIKENVQDIKNLKIDRRAAQESVRNLKQQQAEIKKLGKESTLAEKLVNTLGKRIVAAFAVERIAAFTRESIVLAQEAKGVQQAFDKIDTLAIDDLRKATQGAVSDLELMKASVNAKNLGVPVEQLGVLFQFATQRAAETGEEVTHLVDSIVRGLGRKSVLVLDNLGISAEKIQQSLGGVGVRAASVEQLTNGLVSTLQSELDPAFQGTVSSADKLNAMFENTKLRIGQSLAPAFEEAVDLLDIMGDAIFGVDKSLEDAFDGERLSEFNKQLRGVTATMLNTFAASQANVSSMKDFQEETDGLAFATENAALLLSENAQEIEEFLQKTREQFILAGRESETFAFFIQQLEERVKSLNDETLGANGQTGILKSLRERLKITKELLENATSQAEINKILRERKQLESDINTILNQRFAFGTDEDQIDDDFTIDPSLEAHADALKVFRESQQEKVDLIQSVEDEITRLYEQQLAERVAADNEYFQNKRDQEQFNIEQQQRNAQIATDLLTSFAELSRQFGNQNAEQQKAFALFIATISAAAAINSVWADVSTTVYEKLALTAIVAATTGAQIAKIQSTSTPSFYEGTDYLRLNGNPKGKDTIPVMAHEGEAIIRASENSKHRGLAKAWNRGKAREWMDARMVQPALAAQRRDMEEQQRKELATFIANGMITGTLNDSRIVSELKRNRYIQEKMLDLNSRKVKNRRFRA